MIGWLLAQTRPILTPLVWSVLMRMVGLVAGAALLAVAVYGVVTPEVALRTLLGWLVGLALLKAVARYLEQYAGHYVAFACLAHLRVQLFRRLEPRSPAALHARSTGDLLSRATRDVDRIEVFFAHTLGPAITAVLVPAAGIVWLGAVASWPAAVVAALGWAAMIAVAALGAQQSVDASSTLRAGRGAIAGHITDSVQGVAEVLAFDAAERRLAQMEDLSADVAAQQQVRARWASARRGVVRGLTLALPILVAGVAAPTVGWESALVAAAAVIGVSQAALAVEEFSLDLDQAVASAVRLREVMDGPVATPEPASPVAAPEGTPGIDLHGVTFSYPGTQRLHPAVEHVDLHLPAGSVTALVGASGAGKSTVGALLARFHDPDAGRVCVGGVDVRDLADSDLRGLVAVVSQRPYLFRGTIRDNLLLGVPEAVAPASEDHLWAALDTAALADAVRSWPRGLDTEVGEHGVQLSGGERQRLALARALLGDPRIVILDEVTSDLDRVTETALVQTLRTALAGRTVVTIAHRLRAVTHADQIVVMDAGRVIEAGTHDGLLDRGGAYAALWARQGEAVKA